MDLGFRLIIMLRILIASLFVLVTSGVAVAVTALPVVAAPPVPLVSPSPSPSATPAPVPAALPGELWINEFLPNPVGTDTGNEWIELANVSSHDIGAGGVTVVRLSGSTLATVPSGTVVKAGEVLLLNALAGSIVNGGDTLILKSGQTELDRVTYDGAGAEGSSWSRISATEGAWTTVPTPGEANPAQPADPTPDPGTGDGSGGSGGTSNSATTRAATATVDATGTGSTKKTTAKKLPTSGLAAGAYLAPFTLAMLYWYVRRRTI